MAVSLPNSGEMNLIINPEIRYHPIEVRGPFTPISSISFLENMTISKRGFMKFRIREDKLVLHLSKS